MTEATILPNNLSQYLLKEEKVIFSGEDVSVDGEAGYNFVVTDKRIVFGKKEKMHDVKHSSISSITWGRQRFPILFVIGLIFITLSLGCLFYVSVVEVYYFDYSEIYLPIIFGIIIGTILIIVFFLHQPEYLAIFSAGRSLKIKGKKEILERLRIEAGKVSYSPNISTNHLT